MTRIHVLKHGEEPPDGFVPDLDVDATSRANSPLSPFFLGPVTDKYTGFEFANFENYWQHLKVYRSLGHLTQDGSLSKEWLAWMKKGAALTRAIRYPAGRGARPEFSYWKGFRLTYVTARKLVYIPGYARLAWPTEEFQELRAAYKAGSKIVIRDFDCYPRQSLTWQQIFDNPHRKAGHGFVLAMMLEHDNQSFRSLYI